MLRALKGCILLSLIILSSCQGNKQHPAVNKVIVQKPTEMNKHVTENIEEVLNYAVDNNGKINDSMSLYLVKLVNQFYSGEEYKNIWNHQEKWLPLGDSLYQFIENSREYGLFPSDYHYNDLKSLRKKLAHDSLAMKDAIMWTKGDLLLTDAFMRIISHIKQGRLMADSLSMNKDTTVANTFFIKTLKEVLAKDSITPVMTSLEPTLQGYRELRAILPRFLDSVKFTPYTYVDYPQKDSLKMIANIWKRFSEEKYLKVDIEDFPDSITFADTLKKVQKMRGLAINGKLNQDVVNKLNSTPMERFKRIAINLDRYKNLPDTLPHAYIWVNIPSFTLRVFDADTVAMESRVVVGKPETPTPLLTSAITDMVLYPKWTIPSSIIKKDILPAMKKDVTYLARKGFSLETEDGKPIDAKTVKWSKYKENIPYKVVQGSGDENALGIFKFNFNNPYDVYLHDTNQRYLFKNSKRALSHGCVRVQEWEKLAAYISTYDSARVAPGKKIYYNMDSIHNWLELKTKKTVYVRNRLPVFIRYFTTEVKKGKYAFYDDVYGEDKKLRDMYFAKK